MKISFLFLLMVATYSSAQKSTATTSATASPNKYVQSVTTLTLEAAFELTKRVSAAAKTLDKTVSLAILDASGTTILLVKGDGVGPHNTEAARRKAFTALSTKLQTLLLMRSAAANADSKNLNSLPELLLLSGGSPIWFDGAIIGSIGVAGGGSAENDDLLAKLAVIPEMGISTSK